MILIWTTAGWNCSSPSSITGASRPWPAVHVAQPAVSLAVKELEREVGAELLVRSRHGVTLTAAGSALVGPARQARATSTRPPTRSPR